MGSQQRFRDWKHRFEMHRASRRREQSRVGTVCIWRGWNAAGAGLGRSSLRDGSCGLRAYTQWLGVTFHDRGSTRGFLAIRNSRQDQKYSMLDSLKGWFVIRVREDGLQRNAGGKKQVSHLRSLQRESGRLLHEPHRVMRFGSVKLIQNKALRPREPPLVAG